MSAPRSETAAPQAAESAKRTIHVAAGVILRPDGQLLLGQRPEGKPWAGWWELPGGKIEAGESVAEALARELDEELGIQVRQVTPWVVYVHEYDHAFVHLAFCRVTGWDGEPRGRENQALAWVDPRGSIEVGPLLPATLPPVRWLNLPDCYGISAIGTPQALPAYLDRLDAALAAGLRLLQLREPGWPDGPASPSLEHAFQAVLARCRAVGARLLVNSVHPADWWRAADGVHLRAADAASLDGRPDLPATAWIGVSAHDATQTAQAERVQADFVVIGAVGPTPSHPGQAGMGWHAFTALAAQANRPAFAIGGLRPEDLGQAQSQGAHGIAVLRHLPGHHDG